MAKKYMAYVSTYTHNNDKDGIKIFDVDMENGRLSLRGQVSITNSSYITMSHNKKFLYAITDFGVESYRILKDGGLEHINSAGINGMRGCYLSTGYEDRHLFCAGYHDGKITVLRISPDTGEIGAITDEVYHKGFGSVAERGFRPHISCVKMTTDNKYLCAADSGIDYVNIYRLDHVNGTLKQADIIRCDIESAPRHLKFSVDGRFMYVIGEMKNRIYVYEYKDVNDQPFFEHVQTIPSTDNYNVKGVAAITLNVSHDGKYITASNAGENSASVFKIDPDTGMLTMLFCLPTSGEYPKDATLFPDSRHLVSLNHESDTITLFRVDYENKCIVMNGRELKLEKGNHILFYELDEDLL